MKKILKIFSTSLVLFFLVLSALFFGTSKTNATEACTINPEFIEVSGNNYSYNVNISFPSSATGTLKVFAGSEKVIEKEINNSLSDQTIIETNPNELATSGWAVYVTVGSNAMYSCGAAFVSPIPDCNNVGDSCTTTNIRGTTLCKSSDGIGYCCPYGKIVDLVSKSCAPDCGTMGTGLDCESSPLVEGIVACHNGGSVTYCCPQGQEIKTVNNVTSCLSEDNEKDVDQCPNGGSHMSSIRECDTRCAVNCIEDVDGNNTCCPVSENEDSDQEDSSDDSGGIDGFDAETGGPSNATFDALNPLKIFSTVDEFKGKITPAGIISRALEFLFPLAGMILFVMIVWGGFETLSTSATKKSMDAGRQRITAAVAGFFLLFATYWIMQLLEVIFGIKVL